MNETLKFSWGHIVAFLAMIMISYVTFTGAAYLYDTNLLVSALWAIASFLVMFVVFVGTQQMKAVEKNFTRSIVLERIGVVLSVVVLVLLVTISPFKHFWTVYSNKSEIMEEFAMSIDSSKSIFENYDAYVEERIEKTLQSKSPEKNAQAELMRLQLQPSFATQTESFDYQTKKLEIEQWIDKARQSSVWNVFVIGNLTKIQSGVEMWKTTLESWSSKKFYDGDMEPYKATYDITSNFNNLKQKFTKSVAFQWRAILWALVGYFCMALPWLLQRRPVKNPNSLFGKKDWTAEEDYEEQIPEQSVPQQEQPLKIEEYDDDTFEI
ncbi:MAG: hypothetical protein IKO90_06900 [Bacteroidales bacterium]|nr:hypothetical protein [Bacteroidales bacterium]MBR4498593.1 hypothetical protein [Bacteroidales bacterium]MBR4690175.1 hypothetical protein [Bacteroidales bacterium]MBR7035224.1 hypothetical protein [Bacteroidales bacterium]